MATVTAFTASRMLEIENGTVVSGQIVGDNLVLTTRGGDDIVAGSVRGPQGIQGPIGEVSQSELDAAIASAIALVQSAGAVTNAMLALDAVTETRIADAAVTTNKLANGAVTTVKLADNSVTSSKIVDGQVGTAELASSAVTNVKIAPGVVTSDKIANSNVTSEKLANGAVTYWKQGFIFLQAQQPPIVDGGIWIIP